MSNLLEQAIIDAEALKQAAYKSAEASLVEKFSKELKESVEKLLEQEEVPEAPSMQIPNSAEQQSEKSSENAFQDVPSSFLDGPDDELITISFDEIKKQINQSLGAEQQPEEMNTSAGTMEMPPEQAAANAAQAPEAPVQTQPIQEELEIDEDILLDEEIELDENILLEMASCSYEKEEQDELEEEMGGDLGSDGDSGENELEEENN